MFSCSTYPDPKVEKTNCVVRVCNTLSNVYIMVLDKSYALCFLKSLQMRVNCLLMKCIAYNKSSYCFTGELRILLLVLKSMLHSLDNN